MSRQTIGYAYGCPSLARIVAWSIRTRSAIPTRISAGPVHTIPIPSVTLVNAKNERTAVARDRIESMEESPVSLMPENLLKELKSQELRDLFSYLQCDKPPQ